MSKTDSSLRLLAILRFSVPSNSSRTLNATQAYDITSSGITLASATGTLVDKDVAVKAAAGNSQQVLAGLSLTTAWVNDEVTVGAEKQEAARYFDSGSSATLAVRPPALAVRPPASKKQSAKACVANSTKLYNSAVGPVTTLNFSGAAIDGVPVADLSNKSKATNPNTTFYGAITVGTGDYKKWQGNYAVLKINTVTGKGVLRIYDA